MSDQPPTVEERLTAVEQSLMYLEHRHDELDEVVQTLRAGITRLRDLTDLLERRVARGERDDRDPLSEKPPHY